MEKERGHLESQISDLQTNLVKSQESTLEMRTKWEEERDHGRERERECQGLAKDVAHAKR